MRNRVQENEREKREKSKIKEQGMREILCDAAKN